MRPTDRFENWFITSLQTDVNDTTSSFRLNKALTVNKARLVINPYDEDRREIVKVTSVDGTLVYVERGDDGTSPQYHLEGTVVALHVFAGDLNDLYAEWADIQGDLEQAAEDANNAADAANLATGSANSAANAANLAAGSADSATIAANNAADSANNAADDANDVANLLDDFNLTIGTVTSGSSSSASIVGTMPNKQLNLVLEKGEQGDRGDTGATWHEGSGVPSSGLGSNDDLYWRTDTNQVYQKQSGSWVLISTISGDTAWGGITGTISDQTDLQNLLTDMLQAIYPVGSIYIGTTNGVMPTLIAGLGTWQRVEGRFIIGVSDTDADFEYNDTGGAKTHTLTEAEMPSHTHIQNSHNHTQNQHRHGASTRYTTSTNHNHSGQGQFSEGTNVANGTSTQQTNYTTATNNATTATNQYTGGGQAHNNMPPFKAKYVWERIA